MSNLVPLSKNQLPAHLRRGADTARAVSTELSAGVTAGFPIISYRGKVWRVRKGGEEINYVDQSGDPIQSIELVLVKSNKMPSKTFYKSKYKEGDNAAPTCWSSDGIKPDAGVKEPQHNACATCPHNQWGSRISEDGKKGRACSDVRRMAVVFADELRRKGTDSHLFLMRVPPASLNPLKDYAEKVLGPAGVEYFAVATRVGFDSAASHPKLTFRVATENNAPRFLSEEEYEAVCTLRDSEDAHRILSEAPEFAEAGTTGGDEGTAKAAEETPAPAPAPAKRAKARPADEEDVEVTTAPAAAQTEDDDEDEDETPPPPPPKAKKKATKPSAPAPADDEDAPPKAAAAPATAKGFDDLLDSLLG
jgi:pyruvate/2-oxoglutarate dehydrogenase complex dihydrolipoamide acyltransferase (E2) component